MKPQTPKKAPKAHRPALIAGVVVIVLILAAPFGYLAAFGGRVMPGVAVNSLAVGGLTKDEAGAKLNAKIAIYENNGLNFTNGKKTVAMDAAHQLVNLDADAGAAAAYRVGRTGNVFNRIAQAAATFHALRHRCERF
jgi:hypothetical protein